MIRELTGRHVLAISLGAFAIIVTANMAMLFSAVGSFPGLVVKNSYVASQGWNARTDAQQALGWTAEVTYAEGALRVHLEDRAGSPVAADLTVTTGRLTSDRHDVTRILHARDQAFWIPMQLGPGHWRVDITTADGSYRKSFRIFVAGAA